MNLALTTKCIGVVKLHIKTRRMEWTDGHGPMSGHCDGRPKT